jgi:hypothetical protein
MGLCAVAAYKKGAIILMNTNEQYRMNRRNFLRTSAATLVIGTLAATNLGTGHAYARGAAAQTGNATLDILNYALTLEHLESRAYSEVLAAGLVSGRARDYFQTFGAHEAAHVDALTQTIRSLGGTPVMAQQNYNWPAFQSQEEVITYFQTVEELGAAAYLGQAPALVGGGDLLTAGLCRSADDGASARRHRPHPGSRKHARADAEHRLGRLAK